MEKLICLFAVLFILSGCKKEGGRLVCTMTYDLSNTKKTELYTKSNNGLTSNRYTQLGSEKVGRLVRASHEDLTAPIFDPNWKGFNGNYPVTAHDYIFGNTDSTFIFYGEEQDERSVDNPMGQNGYIVRSNKYTPTTIQRIPEGETRTIRGSHR